MKKILEKFIKAKHWIKLVLFKKTDYNIPITTRINYALKGFTVNEYVWYDLKKNNYKNYISDYVRLKSRDKINNKYKFILDDKLIFEEIFRNYIKVPYNYGYVSNGHIYSLHNYEINNERFLDFIKEKRNIVIKYLNGGEGNGVYIIKYRNEKFEINGKKTTKQEIRKLIKQCGESIICEYITQSKFENEIYDKATNTIRIVCAKKKGETHAKILKAVQRIGTDYCAPIDNVSAGGLASEIDIETGRLSYAISKYGPMERRMKKMPNHPDNNNQIEGKVIPNWNKIKEEIENVTNKFPYLNFVAWDVLLTEEGICIIEGNASSGCGLFQLEHGIKNEEYGDILRSYGVFK